MPAKIDQQRYTLRLRTQEFDWATRAVLGTDRKREIADALGVGEAVLSLYRHGHRPVNAEFVAACQVRMPTVPFERLFEVIEA